MKKPRKSKNTPNLFALFWALLDPLLGPIRPLWVALGLVEVWVGGGRLLGAWGWNHRVFVGLGGGENKTKK